MRTRALFPALAVLALLAAACGGDDAAPTTGAATTMAATTTTATATTAATTTTTAATTTTTTLPPEPEVGWMAWSFADPGDGTLPPCRGCSGGETPLERRMWAKILFVDEAGTVWANRDDGLMLWDPVSGRVDLLGRQDGLLDTLVYAVVRSPGGLLWLPTYGGANTWDGTSLAVGLNRDRGLRDNTTWDLWVQSDGTIWVDTNSGYILTAFDGTTFRHYSDAATASTAGSGIEPVFPERTQFNSGMTETPDGTLWFGSNGNGLFSFDGTEWRRYTEADGLPSNSVKNLAVTPDGTLWLSAIGGLARFDGASFELIDPDAMGDWSGAYPDILAVGPDGALWVMTMSSLFRHLDGAWEIWKRVDGLDFSLIYSLTAGEDGSVWVSTNNGVARYGPMLPVGHG